MGADGTLDSTTLDPVTASWWDEYRFLRVIPLTHDQYLDAPPRFVRWMLEIDSLVSAAQRKSGG